MANVVHTNSNEYSSLSSGAKSAVDTAVTAIRAAFTASVAGGKKSNVDKILREIVRGQEET